MTEIEHKTNSQIEIRTEEQDRPSTVYTPQGPPINIAMTSMPWVPGLFTKLIALSAVRPSDLHSDAVLKNAVIRFNNYALEMDKLTGFRRLCGYRENMDYVPAPFIQTLFIGLMTKFISSSYFPITPLGLIQVGQSIELLQPIPPEIQLDLSCRLLDMTRTDRGIHTQIRMEARIAGTNEDTPPVWQGTALYFTRSKHPGPKIKKPIEDIPLPTKETFEVPLDTGLRYAAVSRDANPHHLYGWTAKLIGFKQPIAHGMWSLARSCASVEKAVGYPDRFKIDGQFKLPIFMPAAVTLGYDGVENETDENNKETSINFELRDKENGRPHLKGNFRF